MKTFKRSERRRLLVGLLLFANLVVACQRPPSRALLSTAATMDARGQRLATMHWPGVDGDATDAAEPSIEEVTKALEVLAKAHKRVAVKPFRAAVESSPFVPEDSAFPTGEARQSLLDATDLLFASARGPLEVLPALSSWSDVGGLDDSLGWDGATVAYDMVLWSIRSDVAGGRAAAAAERCLAALAFNRDLYWTSPAGIGLWSWYAARLGRPCAEAFLLQDESGLAATSARLRVLAATYPDPVVACQQADWALLVQAFGMSVPGSAKVDPRLLALHRPGAPTEPDAALWADLGTWIDEILDRSCEVAAQGPQNQMISAAVAAHPRAGTPELILENYSQEIGEFLAHLIGETQLAWLHARAPLALLHWLTTVVEVRLQCLAGACPGSAEELVAGSKALAQPLVDVRRDVAITVESAEGGVRVVAPGTEDEFAESQTPSRSTRRLSIVVVGR